MGDLSKLRVYEAAEIDARLQSELPRWRHEHNFLKRTYKAHGWKGTLMVVNAIGHLAETAWHHPELLVTYPSVEVRLQTHDAGGITDRDFELARKIEDVVMWRPAQEGGALEGTPQDDGRSAYIEYE